MMLYEWIKVFHIVAVISWMAALLYLPRLMVYHCEAETGSQQSETFKVMERRLLRYIANPAMVVSWVTGLWLMLEGSLGRAGWMQSKLLLAVILSAMHGLNAKWVKDFAAERNSRSPLFYRVVNEAPTLLMIGIVILVVIKPF
jgi:putative membrane protein